MSKKRNQIIDFAKLTFVLAVVANHLDSIASPAEKAPAVLVFGFLGVEFSFIVSGYLMAAKAFRDSSDHIGKATWSFLSRKISIIFPYYIVAWVIGFSVIHFFPTFLPAREILKDFIRSIPDVMYLMISGIQCYQVLEPAWYVSAMLLGMLILYPLVLKYKDTFMYICAPAIAIFCYGYISMKNGHLATINPFQGGIVYSGLLRGFAGMSLGCVCYLFANKIKKAQMTKLSSHILSGLEIFSFVFALVLMRTYGLGRIDFIIVILFAVFVSVAFSEKSSLAGLIVLKHTWIGKAATCLYFAEAPARKFVIKLMPDAFFAERLLPCLIFIVIFTLIVMIFGNLLRRGFSCVKTKVKPMLFVVEA